MKSIPAAERLKRYREKRDFTRTVEPTAALGAQKGTRFVIHKHDARRLHYDLRLQLDGVLLSWAVPEGPSYVPTKKRLAVRTEDHPLKYLAFEGTIPKGEYGGGTMIVWDTGNWAPAHDPHKSLAKGHLEFELKGERLKGRWHLVRIKPRKGEKTEPWLLIKAADSRVRSDSDQDILAEFDTSVISGRDNRELSQNGAVRVDHKKRAKVAAARAARLPDVAKLKGARKALLRVFVEPCLASLAESPPSGSKWCHEIKFDGYRIQARVDGPEVKLLTRSGLDWTKRFSVVANAVRELGLPSAILDGELVVEDAAGISNFNALVSDLKSGRQERFRYQLFDLLYLDGTDLQNVPLVDRKVALSDILTSAANTERLALSEHFFIDGAKFFEHVSRLGLEGMISKRLDAPYHSGRTKDWLKSKCVESQEFVVVGFVPSTTARRAIGSLVLGFYEKGQLIHAGRVGTGFAQGEAETLFTVLESIKIDKSLFGRKLVRGADIGVRWVEPRLVVEVEYRGWSTDDLLRHASFRGLREDKDPREIMREGYGVALERGASNTTAISHPERMLWPSDGITKQGLADFYAENVRWIMPHLTNRPLSLVRCPGGIDADCFYAKHGWAGLSKSVRRVQVGGSETMLVIDDIEGLMALVQGNVLEIHPWGSTTKDLDRPDRLTFDLDPGDGVSWSEVIEAAREVRERLKSTLRVESFVKTTGGKGLHVVVPLISTMDWDAAKAACKRFAEGMAADNPAHYVANMAKAARRGRIFIDYLRNGRGATAVAAYSTRARAGATISTPLEWDELSEALKSDHYRLSNIGRRLANMKHDPWVDFFKIKQRMVSDLGAKAGRTTKRK